MKNFALHTFFAVMAFITISNTVSNAQFSKAVIVLKGAVLNETTQKAHSVNVSVREIGNPALEITGSRSNSETGKYLVILKPNTKYWVHLENGDIETKDIQIVTPSATGKTVNMEQDFLVQVLSTQNTAKK